MSEVDFSNITLDDVKILGQEPQPEVQPEVQQTQASDTPAPEVKQEIQPEVQPEVKSEVKPEVKSEPPTYKFKDDFIKQAVEYYEKTGDLTPYLQAKTVDFQGMTDEEVMRRNLREQYPEVSEKAFDKLFKKEIIEKFKLEDGEWDEDEAELGRELLKAEAGKIRNKYIDWQKQFQAPEPEVTKEQEAIAEAYKKFEESVKTSEFTKQVLESKRIAIKTGDDEFNFEVNQPDALVEMTLNNDKFFAQFANDNGQLDYARWYKTAAYSQNPELFEKSLINYGKAIGRNEVTKEIKNPSTSPVNEVPTESSGDFSTGLLQAFANRGIHK